MELSLQTAAPCIVHNIHYQPIHTGSLHHKNVKVSAKFNFACKIILLQTCESKKKIVLKTLLKQAICNATLARFLTGQIEEEDIRISYCYLHANKVL